MPTEAEVVTPAPEIDESLVSLAEERENRKKEKETPAAAPKEPAKTAPVSEAGKSSEEEDEEAVKGDKPKGGFQRRIDKLTKEKYDLERTVSDMQSRLDALETKKPEVKAEAKAEGDPEPKEEDFKDYKEYAKSLARWVARQELKADRDSAKQAEETEARKASDARAKEKFDAFIGELRTARESDSAFESAIQAGLQIPNWLDFEAKKRGATGAKIIIALAKNKAAYDEIIRLNNEAVERGDNDFSDAYDEFGAFVRSLRTSPEKKVEKPVSQAPAPITPVTGGTGPTEQNFDDEHVSIADYRKRRNR